MKRILSLICAVLVFSAVLITPSVAEASAAFDGSGTAEDPYIIASYDDFVSIWSEDAPVNSEMLYSGVYFRQTADFEVSLNRIADEAINRNRFAGVYDGNGHTITISNSDNKTYSLFRSIRNGTVKNLNLAGEVNFVNDGSAYGAFAWDISGSALIINCHSAMNVTATAAHNINIGGYTYTSSPFGGVYPQIVNCVYSGTMSMPNAVSGGTNEYAVPFVYYKNNYGTITKDCYYDSTKTTPVAHKESAASIGKTTEEINSDEFCNGVLNELAYAEQTKDKTLQLNEWVLSNGELCIGSEKIFVPNMEVKVWDDITNVANDSLSNLDKVSGFIEISFDDEMDVSTLNEDNIKISGGDGEIAYEVISADEYKYVIDISSLQSSTEHTISIDSIKTAGGALFKKFETTFKTGKILPVPYCEGKVLANIAYKKPVHIDKNAVPYTNMFPSNVVDGKTGMSNACAISGTNKLYWRIDLLDYYDVVAIETVQRGGNDLINDTRDVTIKLSREEYDPFDGMPNVYSAGGAGLRAGANYIPIENEYRDMNRYVFFARNSLNMLYCEEIRAYAWIDSLNYGWTVTKNGNEVKNISGSGAYTFTLNMASYGKELPKRSVIASKFDADGVIIGAPIVQQGTNVYGMESVNIVLDDSVKKVTAILIDETTGAMMCDALVFE